MRTCLDQTARGGASSTWPQAARGTVLSGMMPARQQSKKLADVSEDAALAVYIKAPVAAVQLRQQSTNDYSCAVPADERVSTDCAGFKDN